MSAPDLRHPDPVPVDADTLPRILAREGFVPPPGGFLALVVEVRDAPVGIRCRAWDWSGTSRAVGWWPASTVKLFAAASALATARRLGFTPAAHVTYDEPGGPHRATLEDLVRAAITPSDNAAFDRLVFLSGHAGMARWLARHRFADTSLWRGYSGLFRDPVTGRGSLAVAPPVLIEEGARQARRRASIDRVPCDVPDHGNRTTLADLADCLCRIIRHDRLPAADRLGLRRTDAALLRDALAGSRERGNGMSDGLKGALGDGVRVFHKPGFACDWFSDVAFVEREGIGPAWIVAMAGRPGRDCLDDAALRVGRLIAGGALQ